MAARRKGTRGDDEPALDARYRGPELGEASVDLEDDGMLVCELRAVGSPGVSLAFILSRHHARALAAKLAHALEVPL